jgi:predicted helicase
VRAIDDILKDMFKIKDGLADHKRVTVLDFACGTGTFIVEVLERIFENIGGSDSGKANLIVRDHMLKNIFGFEYLIAPYTIAHLKLSQYLADKNHALKDGERLQVFLTNTLEPMEAHKNLLLPALSEESASAQRVKEKPILVITGNPPYSGHSKNKGAWITAAIEEYKFVTETDARRREHRKPLGEKNPKWLSDDYVKFIRFAQMKMDGGIFKVEDNKGQLHEVQFEGVEEGVVGIITNHSWLDNPTFRGMRTSLMSSFEQIYVLDLHGSAKKKGQTRKELDVENVFDIEQGVAISLFVKKRGIARGVFHHELWGRRIYKYKTTAEARKAAISWTKLSPVAPHFLFICQDNSSLAEYSSYTQVTKIFVEHNVGIVTARDDLTIQFDRQTIRKIVQDFANGDTEAMREKYSLGKDAQDWKVAWAQKDLRDSGPRDNLAAEVRYRPFDRRWTYYTGRSRGFHCRPRDQIMRHMFAANVGLLTCRQVASGNWQHVFAFEGLVDDCIVSNRTKERGYLFPLYLYPPLEQSPKKLNR